MLTGQTGVLLDGTAKSLSHAGRRLYQPWPRRARSWSVSKCSREEGSGGASNQPSFRRLEMLSSSGRYQERVSQAALQDEVGSRGMAPTKMFITRA